MLDKTKGKVIRFLWHIVNRVKNEAFVACCSDTDKVHAALCDSQRQMLPASQGTRVAGSIANMRGERFETAESLTHLT